MNQGTGSIVPHLPFKGKSGGRSLPGLRDGFGQVEEESRGALPPVEFWTDEQALTDRSGQLEPVPDTRPPGRWSRAWPSHG